MTLKAALHYAALGWPVHPLIPRTKIPATNNGLRDATTDQAQIKKWWRDRPNSNVGILAPIDVLILDLDKKHGKDGIAEINKHAPPGEELSQKAWGGPWERTPTGGGAHVPMRWPEGVPPIKTASDVLPGVDIRGLDNAYIVASPSKIKEGAYRWLSRPGKPSDVPMAPHWIVNLLSEVKPKPKQRAAQSFAQQIESTHESVLDECVSSLMSAQSGARNETLNKVAYRLGRWCQRGSDEFSAYSALRAATDLPEREFNRTFESGWRSGEANPHQPKQKPSMPRPQAKNLPPKRAEADLSDISNASRLIHEHGDSLLNWPSRVSKWRTRWTLPVKSTLRHWRCTRSLKGTKTRKRSPSSALRKPSAFKVPPESRQCSSWQHIRCR
jgi:hypothetical protein